MLQAKVWTLSLPSFQFYEPLWTSKAYPTMVDYTLKSCSTKKTGNELLVNPYQKTITWQVDSA